MPEGPEARVVADQLSARITGLLLSDINIISTPFVTPVDPTKHQYARKPKHQDHKSLALPTVITQIYAYGKKVIMSLADGHSIVTSLGMTGQWLFQPGAYTRVRLDLSSPQQSLSLSREILTVTSIPLDLTKIISEYSLEVSSALYFNDMRRMGSVDVVTDVKTYLAEFGPDPLTEDISPERWRAIFRAKRNTNWQICKALLEQRNIVGIGNYLKAEILYATRIHPARRLCEITDSQLEDLRTQTLYIIRDSYRHQGLTIADFISPDGQPGVYPHKVYKKATDPLGNPVRADKFKDGRDSTYWVPALQF